MLCARWLSQFGWPAVAQRQPFVRRAPVLPVPLRVTPTMRSTYEQNRDGLHSQSQSQHQRWHCVQQERAFRTPARLSVTRERKVVGRSFSPNGAHNSITAPSTLLICTTIAVVRGVRVAQFSTSREIVSRWTLLSVADCSLFSTPSATTEGARAASFATGRLEEGGALIKRKSREPALAQHFRQPLLQRTSQRRRQRRAELRGRGRKPRQLLAQRGARTSQHPAGAPWMSAGVYRRSPCTHRNKRTSRKKSRTPLVRRRLVALRGGVRHRALCRVGARAVVAWARTGV